MKRKQVVAILGAMMLAVSAVGCQQKTQTQTNQTAAEGTAGEVAEENADYSNSTLTGKITAMEGTSVTLTLGELTEPEMKGGPGGQGGMQGGGPGGKGGGPGGQGGMQGGGPDGQGGSGFDTMPDNGSDPSGAGSSGTDASESDNSSIESQPTTQLSTEQGQQGQTPPEMAEGSESQTPSDMPEGENGKQGGRRKMVMFEAGEETAVIDLAGVESVNIDDLEVGDVIVVEVGDNNIVTSVEIQDVFDGNMQGPGGMGGQMPGGGSGEVTQGTSANTIDADGTYTGESYSSTGDDENALRVDGAKVTLDGITVDKSQGSSSNVESGDFYGMNAALLATNGATVTIKDATVTSSAQNGNGVFSYGEGTTVNISDSTIHTTADNSGGIQTTGGGTTNASNLTVTTEGNSSAAIRSDRGGGTVNVDGGSYTSKGYNSPAIYSTAAITVSNADLTAENSEALVIEGRNSITLNDCDVTGNMSDDKGSSSDVNVHNVMIYQSMSGDADVGTSEFSMTGGTLTGENGDQIYVTNTHSVISMSQVTLKNLNSDGVFLRVTGNDASHGWGTAGSNGAQATFTATDQTIDGDIVVDTISTLSFTLSGNSTLTGTVNIVDNAEGGTAVEKNAVITIEKGSAWNLTGNCTITSLNNQGTVNFNGYTITLADGTILSE